MHQIIITILCLAAPSLFLGVALLSKITKKPSTSFIKSASLIAALSCILICTIATFMVIRNGTITLDLLLISNLGLGFRLDALSVTMFSMISLICFIVVKFTCNYLDGDPRQNVFIGRLAATIASVYLFVLSGNLFILILSWILTSVSLHRLLLFYHERPGAIIAARKKFIIARAGDICLVAASILLYNQFGTGSLETIFEEIKTSSNGNISASIQAAAIFLTLAAMLKSAQFPTHGWLIEVMETPTPVSALLHAGLLNAGPLLIIRMAFIVQAGNYSQSLLIIIGGFTALFGSVVYLTQTSIKTALSYSSVAHMGFSLFICGLGLFPAALLHLVAHSFYKAHAFLSSGSVIDILRASKFTNLKRKGNPVKILAGISTAIIIYVSVAAVAGVNPAKDFPLFTIGAIMVMGLSRILTSAFDSDASNTLLIRACISAFLVSVSFFTLEGFSTFILSSQIPESPAMSSIEKLFAGGLLMLFAIGIFAQIVSPTLINGKSWQAMAVHLRNGLYINAVFDRMIGALIISIPQRTVTPTVSTKEVPRRIPTKLPILEEQTV